MKGLPHIARCLYFAIRETMDFGSGYCGVRQGCRISWQGLCESLYVEPHQGYTDTGTPNKSKVRRAGQLLEKSGLIVNKSQVKKLIFFLPLATQDKSVQNKPDTNPTHIPDIEADTGFDLASTEDSNVYHFFPKEGDIEPDIPETPKPDTHPVSGSNKHTYSEDVSEISVGWAIQFMIRNGLSIRSATDPYARKEIQNLISIGATIEDFKSAIKKAYMVKESGSFGIGYLKPIVNEIIQKRNFPAAENKTNGRSKRKSAVERGRDALERHRLQQEQPIAGVAERVDN